MKFLAFVIILLAAFWFFFGSKPAVVNNDNFNNEKYSQTRNEDEIHRKNLSDMDARDLNNEVSSGLNKIDSTLDNISSKAKNAASPILENENVKSFITGFNIRWHNFKIWFSNLPGIKQYNKSVYSEKNWKREMDATDFAEYTSEQSTGARMLREGTDKFKKL